MQKQNKKLIAPFQVRIENGLGWQTESVESAEEAKDLGRRYISKWQSEGLLQLRDGAYLFVNEAFTISKSLKIFNANEKLVTTEVLVSK